MGVLFPAPPMHSNRPLREGMAESGGRGSFERGDKNGPFRQGGRGKRMSCTIR